MVYKGVPLIVPALFLCVLWVLSPPPSQTPHGNGVSFRDAWFTNDPLYTFSEAYRTSVWYDNFSALSPNENQREYVLRIALSQLGYREGDAPTEIDGKGKGQGNYVEYTRLVTHFPPGENWCAAFVNWCFSQARITHAGGEIGCQRWIDDFFKPQNLFQNSIARHGTYDPQPADVIFFDWDNNRRADHVGLVLCVQNSFIYTIEGNTENHDVGIRRYDPDDACIIGYGTPAYTDQDG